MCRLTRVTGLALLTHLAVTPAYGQQGAIRISGTAQALTGAPERIGGQERLEPDVALSWLQPGSRFGTFHIEIRGTTRKSSPHLGRSFATVRDLKFGGLTWSFDAGDLSYSPGNEAYRFTNLVANPVTLLGGSLAAKSAGSSVQLVGGRTTAWRNIFGTDSDALDQTLALGRVSHKPLTWLTVNGRASHVRTRNLDEFTYSIAASDQASAGLHVSPSTTFHIIADGGYGAYRRVGSNETVRDASGTLGVTYLHSRGWLQANAFRFSPGELPVINYALNDRRGLFVAAEYDVWKRVRLYGGWESIDSNLDPERAAATPLNIPESTGNRTFGGLRVILFPRISLSVRADEGGRRTRRRSAGFFVDSDSGVFSSELFGQFGRVTSFLRYSRRHNVESTGEGDYDQSDAAFQMFVNLSRDIQLFGSAGGTRNIRTGGAGSTSWQFGGGGHLQLFRRALLVRLEGTTVRNEDLLTDQFGVRDSLNVGVNGSVARHTTIGFDLYADRSPAFVAGVDPWMTRSTLRIVRSFATGSMRVSGAVVGPAAEVRARGTGTVAGTVFADWNGDGVPGPGEDPLEGISVLLARAGATTSSARGEFTFSNVPTGSQHVQVDIAALPVDFDPPSAPGVELSLARNETRRVAFGLVPLGSVSGRVLRDANGNGSIDAADEPLEGAVLVLDGGLRSEQVRKGRFRFDAIRSGSHVLDLLVESLPEGSTLLTSKSVAVTIGREGLARTADFLVKIDKRPEIRRVFPPKGGGPTPVARGVDAVDPPAIGTSPARVPNPTTGAVARFTIQIAALSQLTRAQLLANELKAAGHAAYVILPRDDDPDGLYRVRVGRFASRDAAAKAMPKLEALRGEKLWIIRGR